MGRRREGRETAVQFLFAHDVHEGAGNPSAEEQNGFWELHSASKSIREFAEHLIKGVLQHLPEVDARIGKACENFSLERIGGVERNILRLGIYELIHTPALPSAIIINEGIEIAKKFCASDSSRFVNGVNGLSGGFLIDFPTQAGFRYYVQYATNSAGFWSWAFR